jgi:acetone carboxylase gamma subunit
MKNESMRIHEYLEIVNKDERKVIRCLKCGYIFGSAKENYKKGCLVREREFNEVMNPTFCLSKEKPFERLQEFICPGCGLLLEVDVVVPELEEDPILWDIQIKL